MKKLIAGGTLAALFAASLGAGIVTAQTKINEAATVTETQAIEIALAEVPGEVTETELEHERGKLIYEVEIAAADGQEMEVEIDAQTGEVLEVEADNKKCDRKKRGAGQRGVDTQKS